MAVDEGILIKAGTDVLVSVRNAIEGSDLVTLEHAVEKEFLRGDAQEQSVRQVMSKMESGFIRRFAEFFRE
jgi:F-type H+-transporting ATPase subunit epsilon